MGQGLGKLPAPFLCLGFPTVPVGQDSLGSIPKTTSATPEKGHGLSQGPLLRPARPGDGLSVTWPGTALASNSGAQIPSLPHLQSLRFPAAQQKPETGTGRGKSPLSPRGCLDEREAALQHPPPLQPRGRAARRPAVFQPPSHPCAPLWAGRQGADGTHGHPDVPSISWARTALPAARLPKKKGWGTGPPAQVGDGTSKTAPWVPCSLENKHGAAGVGLSSLLLLFLRHPGSVWEGDRTRAWRGCERPASPAPRLPNLPPPLGTKP